MGDIATPSLLLDLGRLDRNIERMRAHLAKFRVPLRPHTKTAKCIEVVRRAVAGQPGGVTVSTLAEASWCFEQGYGDIVYAVGIVPQRLPEAAAMMKRGCGLKLLLDAPETARAVAEAGHSLGVCFPALLELDSDGHRAGLAPCSDELLQCARLLHDADGSELAGVLTHAGESYNCRSGEQIAAMAETARSAAQLSADFLRDAGLPIPVVSVGSTPTATFARDLRGVTEVRAGVYMFNDLVMTALGVCTRDEIALSVLSTVIGHQRRKGWILIDAGWMALSRDKGPSALALDHGYGIVCDEAGAPIGDLIVVGANQEHGIVASRSGDFALPADLLVGTRLRILPIHACATAAMHDSYGILGADGTVNERWPRMRGWAS